MTTLTVSRSGVGRFAPRVAVRLDGEQVADLARGDTWSADVPAGDHVLAVSAGWVTSEPVMISVDAHGHLVIDACLPVSQLLSTLVSVRPRLLLIETSCPAV